MDKEGTRDVIARISPEDAGPGTASRKVGAEAINEVFGWVMATPMMTMLDALKVGMSESPS